VSTQIRVEKINNGWVVEIPYLAIDEGKFLKTKKEVMEYIKERF